MKKTILVLLILGLMIIPVGTALAWGPHTHTKIAEDLFERQNSDTLAWIGSNEDYKSAFLAGSMLPDITVAYYFSEGRTKYRATHNWNFQERLMAQAGDDPYKMAFAYGVAAHLVADSVSHTGLIPLRIQQYGIPNWLIHPLTEKKYDSLLALEYEGLKDRSKHMMDAILTGPRKDELITMVENALGTNSGIDVEENLIRLGYALDSFYDEGGKRPAGGGVFAIYPVIDELTDWVYPLSTGSMGEVDMYYLRTLEQCENVYNNWDSRKSLSPHGFEEIGDAEKGTLDVFQFVFFAYLFLMFALPLFLMWWRRDPRFLIFVPVMFFIMVIIMAIIYILI